MVTLKPITAMKLDKTAFSHQSLCRAEQNRAYWLSKTPEERFMVAYELSLRAYQLDPDEKHKLDRTLFCIVKREE